MNFLRINKTAASGSVILIPLTIFIIKELEIILRFLGIEIASPSDSENWFISNFIEWFGVLYGILLPLILVRVWEQLDDIDREFDKEADTVKILYKDLYYLSEISEEVAKIGKKISNTLYEYAEHVTSNYQDEIKKPDSERLKGDQLLEQIREQLKNLINQSFIKNEILQFLVRELFEKYNEIVDIRGDRISLASQRLFESLRLVALITSIVFLIPFYFAGITTNLPFILDFILLGSVTFLVIYIYMLIEDFDQPFDGARKISDESWKRLVEQMRLDREKENQVSTLQ